MIKTLETSSQPKNEPLLSRREFTKEAVAYLVALGLIAMPATAVSLTDFDLIYPNKYLSEVPIGNGRKVKLILGRHDGPGETKIDPGDFTRPIAGIFWDSRDQWLDQGFTSNMDRYVKTPSTRPFYSEGLRLLRSESVPGIFGDSPLSDSDINVALQENYSRHIIAVSSSAVAALGLSMDAFNKLTRRDFLKRTAKLVGLGGVISSAYFSSDSLAEAAQRLGVMPKSDTVRELTAILSDLIHPDNYITVMRNIIWALKIKDLYDQKIFPSEQIVNVLGGGNHRFVGFFLKHPDIAENYFKIFQYKDVIKRIWAEEKRDWVHKTLIYRYNDNSQYVENQALQRLLS